MVIVVILVVIVAIIVCIVLYRYCHERNETFQFEVDGVVIVTGLPVQSQPQGIVGCAIKEDGGLKTCVCFPVWNPPASRTSLVFRHYIGDEDCENNPF